MGQDANSIMVIHGGVGNKTETIDRWKRQFMEMPEAIQTDLFLRIVKRLLHWRHHSNLRKPQHPYRARHVLRTCTSITIQTTNKNPLKLMLLLILGVVVVSAQFHQRTGSGVGHHSDFVEKIPKYLLKIKKKHKIDIDIMIEARWRTSNHEVMTHHVCSNISRKRRFDFRIVLVLNHLFLINHIWNPSL